MIRRTVSIQKSMFVSFLALLMVISLAVPPAPMRAESSSNGLPGRQAEYLNRGLVAVLVDNGVF